MLNLQVAAPYKLLYKADETAAENHNEINGSS